MDQHRCPQLVLFSASVTRPDPESVEPSLSSDIHAYTNMFLWLQTCIIETEIHVLMQGQILGSTRAAGILISSDSVREWWDNISKRPIAGLMQQQRQQLLIFAPCCVRVRERPVN